MLVFLDFLIRFSLLKLCGVENVYVFIFAPTKPDSRKRKLNSHHLSCDSYPLPKQAKHVATKRKMKDVATESKDIPPLKRPCCHSITTTATNPVIPERYRFNPVSQEW